MNSYVVEHQLRLGWVGDRCPSRHLFEIGCHVLLGLVMGAISNKSVLSFALSICVCSSLLSDNKKRSHTQLDSRKNQIKCFLNIFKHRTRCVFLGRNRNILISN